MANISHLNVFMDNFISRQMGHSTSQITKDNYTDLDYHLSKEKILKLYNNLYYLKSNQTRRSRI